MTGASDRAEITVIVQVLPDQTWRISTNLPQEDVAPFLAEIAAMIEGGEVETVVKHAPQVMQ